MAGLLAGVAPGIETEPAPGHAYERTSDASALQAVLALAKEPKPDRRPLGRWGV